MLSIQNIAKIMIIFLHSLGWPFDNQNKLFLLSIRSAITYYSSNWEVKNMNSTNFCARRKTKDVKQAVHGTKKITQYHAQLTGWLHVCALVCSEEKFSITQDLLKRCKKLQDFFHSSTTLIPTIELIKKKELLTKIHVLSVFLHDGPGEKLHK